jgi:hypothetical protein
MKYLNICLLIILFIQPLSLSQVENIPVENTVYDFLKIMQIKGIIQEYDDFLLPLSRQEISDLIRTIKGKERELSRIESEILDIFIKKFNVNDKPSSLLSNSSGGIVNLFYYSDSLINLTVNPILGARSLSVLNENANNASIFKLGGHLYGSYDDWFGFLLAGTNEVVFGSREAALRELSIAQSFTFNDTKINFADYTSGYIRLKKEGLSLQLGRERLLLGSGYNNRMVLSHNPPIFDFIRFNFDHKYFNYKFLHGWLVQPKMLIPVDSIFSVGEKLSKYIALSRLGFNPSSRLKLGISQFIIYANRPFELAYMNPFLFWESAQRSMNDLDNSFLSFDARFLLTEGMEINSSIIFDDIHFERLFKDGWNIVDNRNAWNAGIILSEPVIFSNLSLSLDYVQVRPYMFSHPGIGEMLTFTNNGYQLGIPYKPNSAALDIKATYLISPILTANVQFDYYLHGDNIRNSEGDLVKNYGGDILEYHTYWDSGKVYLLEGNLSKQYLVTLGLSYELINFLYLNFSYSNFSGLNSENIFRLSMNYEIF